MNRLASLVAAAVALLAARAEANPKLVHVDFPAGPLVEGEPPAKVPKPSPSAWEDDFAEHPRETPPGPPSSAPPQDVLDVEPPDASLSPELARPAIAVPHHDVQAAHDPQLAVSHHFIVALEAHTFAFYDKQHGKRLPRASSLHTAGSVADVIFEPFFADQIGGKPNPHNLSHYLPSGGFMHEAYDARVLWDSVRERFIFVANSRGNLTPRFTLIAVSDAEDPRKGFHEYLYTDGGDDPRAAVDDKHLAIASSDGAQVFLFDAHDLAKGAASPGFGRFETSAFSNGVPVIPVNTHAPWPGKTLFMERVHAGLTSVRVYAFPDLKSKPIAGVLKLKAGARPLAMMRIFPGAVPSMPTYRGGKLYLTTYGSERKGEATVGCKMDDIRLAQVEQNATASAAKLAAAKTIGTLGPCSVRIVGFEISLEPHGISGHSIADVIFGHSAPGDPPGDVLAYGIPGIAVSKKGEVVAVYLRTQYATLASGEIHPEARYSVLYPGEKGIRRSRLLHAGLFGNRKPTKSDKIVQSWAQGLDISAAVVDPDDEQTVWMAHVFGADNDNGYQLVLGAVRP